MILSSCLLLDRQSNRFLIQLFAWLGKVTSLVGKTRLSIWWFGTVPITAWGRMAHTSVLSSSAWRYLSLGMNVLVAVHETPDGVERAAWCAKSILSPLQRHIPAFISCGFQSELRSFRLTPPSGGGCRFVALWCVGRGPSVQS